MRSKFDIKKGDRVLICSSMEHAAVMMLVCARIGALYSVAPSTLAPELLALRMDDFQPKLVVSSNHLVETF